MSLDNATHGYGRVNFWPGRCGVPLARLPSSPGRMSDRTKTGRFMRFLFLIAAGAGVGALAAFAIPANVVQSTSSTIEEYGTAAGHLPHDLADLNPIRMAYDVVAKRIRQDNTPEQLGFKPSAVTFKPFVISSGMAAQIDPNNRRMEDVHIYPRNPA